MPELRKTKYFVTDGETGFGFAFEYEGQDDFDRAK
jgi:hypothetical protein